mgnify:CR=1 FL=1
MALNSRICEMLGIEYPIFAFTHCRDVVVAVSKAGGFGVLGVVGFSPEQLEVELDWIDEHVGGKPYGVDTVMPQKAVDVHGADPADVGHTTADLALGHRLAILIHDTHIRLQSLAAT